VVKNWRAEDTVVAEPAEDLDLLIDNYLDDRMPPHERANFEDRLSRDPELRSKVNSATRSVDMVQQALGWVTPGDDFDEQVNSKIISITQSGQNLRPFVPSNERSLTSADPDAKLLADPEAVKERQRLLVIGVAAGVIFLLAAMAIGFAIAKGAQKQPPVPHRITQ
jgi:anti-sigma factor RsiW